MIDGVIAVLMMKAAFPEDMLGDEQDPKPLDCFGANAGYPACAEFLSRLLHAGPIGEQCYTAVKSTASRS